MGKDRFDEYYLMLTQAKNQEKLGFDSQALTIYLQIIDSFSPDTDNAYERAVTLLEKKRDFEQARQICVKALEKIRSKDIKGDTNFYEQRLNRIEDKLKETIIKPHSPVPTFLKSKTIVALIITYCVAALILSLPDKYPKFTFIIFTGTTVVFVIDVIRNALKNILIRLQIMFLIVSIILTIGSAALVPPPDWVRFPWNGEFYKLTTAEVLEGPAPVTKKKPTEKEVTNISSEELDTLEQQIEKSYIINDYVLTVEEKNIDLAVFLAPSVSEDEAKEAVDGLLIELNSIKGYDAPTENKLGDLYKYFSVSIKAYDSFGVLLLNGQVNRMTQKIGWR